MWNAQYVSKEVYYILDEESSGSVHSIFNRSFNIIFADRLIHIGPSENGLAPFGIGVDQLDVQMLTRRLKLGQSIRWNARSKALHFMSGDIVSLQSATVTDHLLLTSSFHRPTLRKNIAYLATKLSADDWQTGIVETNREKQLIMDYLSRKHSISLGLSDHPVITELQQLQTLLFSPTKEATPVFNYWIGRGPGLTPSGDDLITGLCAAFAGLAQNDLQWMEQLDSYLKNYGNERTTAVSVAYLSYAVKHIFHSQLIRVIEGLLKTDEQQLSTELNKMKEMGHTSGTDTLIGVLVGVDAVLSKT